MKSDLFSLNYLFKSNSIEYELFDKELILELGYSFNNIIF